jgi:hypothetical protein
MLRRATLGVLLSGALCGAAAAAPAQGAEMRRCGEIGRAVEGTAVLVTVRSRDVACPTARRIVSDADVAAARGFHCDSAGAEKVCEKGDRRASYRAARRTRSCGRIGFMPNTDDMASSITAKGIRCRRARAVARGARDADPTDPGSYELDGFRCVGTALGTPLPSALFSCRAGNRASVAFIRT